ncbi:hypothetical protein [Streptacidiphilus neutrinimicus]|uniref:hypothetical protein n=1 Tax=Streptacidiphilus neutrinimicus TaxID=105420 RepID=UPI0005A75D9B|nr:hypothetical protein [Streptacidiphilus neutrinimicus]
MPDPTPLLAAAERLADRFRTMPQSSLARQAPAGLELARTLARASGATAEIPDAGAFVVGDQIAVAAHDLALTLTASEGPEADRVLADALKAIAELR